MVRSSSKSPVDRENFDQRLSPETAPDGSAIIKRQPISLERFMVLKTFK
jgi:hypothetical protein